MIITSVEVISSNKRAKIEGGLYITYTSIENATMDSKVELEFEGVKHYFSVTDISINGKDLNITAKEVGYWAKQFTSKPNFDIRTLIGSEVTKVEDPAKISKINEMSCWC